jgi:hypothetical protein
MYCQLLYTHLIYTHFLMFETCASHTSRVSTSCVVRSLISSSCHTRLRSCTQSGPNSAGMRAFKASAYQSAQCLAVWSALQERTRSPNRLVHVRTVVLALAPQLTQTTHGRIRIKSEQDPNIIHMKFT